jgi:hypothetical protein
MAIITINSASWNQNVLPLVATASLGSFLQKRKNIALLRVAPLYSQKVKPTFWEPFSKKYRHSGVNESRLRC